MGEGGEDLVAKLHRNTAHFRKAMTEAGFTIRVCIKNP